MGRTYHASGTYDSADLTMLTGVYYDVCGRISEENRIVLTASQVRETIAVAIFNLAETGVRDTERLWCHAMREVAALHRTLAMAR